MKSNPSYLPVCYFVWLCFLISLPIQAENEDGLNHTISFPHSKGTIYELLEKVTELSGFLFIYDAEVLNNEQTVDVKEGEYTLRQVIYAITGNPRLSLRIIGSHIVIQLPEVVISTLPGKVVEEIKDTIPTHFTIEGAVTDKYSNEPVPFASVGVPSDAIGTITNLNGEFRLRLPDSLRSSSILLSHIGYIPQTLELASLIDKHTTFPLEPKVLSIQEIVVRLVNPQRLIRDMLDKRKVNYATDPVYYTSFYREGIERRKGFVDLTEAVFKIYKTPYDNNSASSDQIKLLKMRRISNEAERDTLITKFKSGINASLLLDIIKFLPEFLSEDERHKYNFISSDITVVNDRIANVIYFEQKKEIRDPLYRGELYIDSKNDALLMAKFEINPRYVEKSADMFIIKKSRNLKIKPEHVSYTVTYQPFNGRYHINHIRGDLYFKVRKKKQILGSTSIHTWFEMVTCKIETENITRFNRNETLPTKTIFSETNFAYDETFWGDFNVILPEEKLSESISKITSKIEETDY